MSHSWYNHSPELIKPKESMTFKDLISHQKILQAIDDAGHTTPTPIQKEVILKIEDGADLRASSETGSGKTAAFILPALQRLTLAPEHPGKGPRILILVPTRELATQVAQEAKKYGKYLPQTKTVCIYGGVPYPRQLQELSRPYEILIATPGRLLDHLERGRIRLSRVELFILDEADRMLDMGFIEPVEEIASLLPEKHQTLLFSATLKGTVQKLSQKLLKNPIEVTIERNRSQEESIDQRLLRTDNLSHKYDLLDHLLKDPAIQQAIVFTATKHQADIVAEKLVDLGHNATSLHGDMNQRQRNRTMIKLRKAEVRILVATDVAARGIDVLTISHIINFDLPRTAEDYVHRIGRTGRAGNKGIAFSFVAAQDRSLVKKIEQFTGQKITHHSIAGLEAKNEGKDHPQRNRFKKNFKPKRFFKKKRFS
jgi:superfamily II DNA/RNA helicase